MLLSATNVRATVTVGLVDFRRALTAVRLHVSEDKELEALYRVRLVIGDENVVFTATDGTTGGLAIASVWDRGSEELPCIIDLRPDDVARILGFFPGRKEKADEPEHFLRLDVLGNRQKLVVTEAAGFIDGDSVTIPALATVEGPLDTLPRRILDLVNGKNVAMADLAVSANLFARFKPAATAYGAPLRIRGHGSILRLDCGDSFLGVLTPVRPSDEDTQRNAEWDQAWTRRLPGIVEAAESERSDTGQSAPAELADITVPAGEIAEYLRAVERFLEVKAATPTSLARELGVSKAAAGRALKRMSEHGIASPPNDDGVRDAVIDPVDREEFLAELRNGIESK